MNVKRNKELEIKIVNLTEQLIQKVIAFNLIEVQERDFVINEAHNIILELLALINDLVDNEEHLESMLNQLILQKLPDEEVLKSFDDFSSVLNELIKVGVNEYKSRNLDAEDKNNSNTINCDITNSNSRNNINNEDDDKIYVTLREIYPEFKILKNYIYRGGRFDYFIPELNIALLINNDSRMTNKGLIDFIAKRHKINLIKLSKKDLSKNEISKYINNF